VEAYLFFYAKISGFAVTDSVEEGENVLVPESTPAPSAERLSALITALTRHLELVVIELEERDDPQVIFETLNARGEPLLPSDLIRNFVFLEASRRREDVERLYATYWHDYDESNDGFGGFWKQEERQGRLVRPRLDLFFFHYLTCQTESDFGITHLFQEFRAWWKITNTVEANLNTMRQYSNVFRQFFETGNKSRVAVFANRLRLLDTSTVYPLLLFLLEEQSVVPTVERDGIVTDLESYLVRRMVCNLTTKNYNRVFLTLLRNLREASKTGTASRDEVRRLLLESEGDSVRWPDDKEFGTCWLGNPVYRHLSSGRIEMLLSAIDLQLTTAKQEQILLAGGLSIEHVMPQNGREADWPLLVSAQDDEVLRQEALERRAQRIHTIGNLTLLTQQLNSSISNGPFAAKRPEIAEQSNLRLNTYFQNFTNSDPWTEDCIVQRGKHLFDTAREIWPYPEKTGS